MKILRLVLIFLCLLAPAAFAATGTIVVFDVPGSNGTFANAINDAGTVVGSYVDAAGMTHGFLRKTDTSIVSIDGPGSGNHFASADVINSAGLVAGTFQDAASVNHGFLRDAAGIYTQFDVPGATNVFVSGINTAGQVSGFWLDNGAGGGSYHGFVRQADGRITTFDVGTGGTFAGGINSSGQVAGAFFVSTPDVVESFMRNADGSVITFAEPGAIGPVGTEAYSINDAGTVAGFYGTSGTPFGHGFTRDAAGKVSGFDFGLMGNIQNITGINATGSVTGYWQTATDNVYHGLVRDPQGNLTRFDVPRAGTLGGQGTMPAAINASGRIVGTYIGPKNVRHGFIRQ